MTCCAQLTRIVISSFYTMRATDESTVQRQAEWVCGQGPDHANSVDWSAIQSLFLKQDQTSSSYSTHAQPQVQQCWSSNTATMEAIVACGFESRAPPPGEYSFTNTLIEVLDDWINKRSFSASCLHAEILFQLKTERNEKGKRRKEVGVVHNAVSYQLFGKFDFSWH